MHKVTKFYESQTRVGGGDKKPQGDTCGQRFQKGPSPPKQGLWQEAKQQCFVWNTRMDGVAGGGKCPGLSWHQDKAREVG